MQELILDSTWSFRFRTLVYLKGQETPIVQYPAKMEKYTDAAVKEAYRNTMDTIRETINSGSKIFMINSQVFRASEIQCVLVKIDLINEMNRGGVRNDYAPMLLDILYEWYVDQLNDEEDADD